MNRPDIWGCAANVAVFLSIVLLVNVPAPLLGLRFDDGKPDVALAPPGWLVVLAWLVLFPAIGVARWLVVTSGASSANRLSWMITGLAILCATYAYYTLGLERLTGISAAVYGLAGNLVVIVAALWLSWRVAGVSHPAAILVAAVAAWTTFASVSVVQMVAKL